MHAGREAAGHQHRVAGDALRRPPARGSTAPRVMALTRRSPAVPSTGGAREHLDAGAAHRIRQTARQLRPHIGDGRDAHAGRVQIERGLIGAVVARSTTTTRRPTSTP